MTGAASDRPPATDETAGRGTHLEIGHVARAHGLRGQVVVELVSNRDERVAPGSLLQPGDGGAPLEVTSSTPAGAVGGRRRWVVGFRGVSDREGAEALRGTVLTGEPLADPDALWVHDLICAEVVDQAGTILGTVIALEANPASDLLVLEGGGLVPLRFVTSVAGGRITVDAPPGLLDL